MKKSRIVIAVLLIAFTVIALSSCAVIDTVYQVLGIEPDNPDQVYRFINSKMNGLDSYEIKGFLSLSANVAGRPVTSTSNNKQIYSGMTTGDYYHYSETSTVSNGKTTDMAVIRYGYYDGTAYAYADGLNGSSTPFTGYSEMSLEEYFKFIRAYDENDAIISNAYPSVLDCQSKSYTHEEDGGWTVSLSNYNLPGLLSILEDIGFDGELFDDEVEDVEIIYVADSEFRCTQVRVRYVFAEAEDQKNSPSLYLTLLYSNYNNVVLNTEEFNKEDYNELSDLSLIAKLEKKLVEAREEKQNTVSLELSNRFTVQHQPYEGVIRRSVTYGEENGKFYFDYGMPERDIADAYYFDGILQYKGAGEYSHDSLFDTVLKQEKIGENIAKGLLESLIFLDFNVYRIKEIEEVSEDHYKLKLNAPEKGSLYGLILYQGVSLNGGEMEMEFKFKDGKLMTVDLDADLNCSLRSGNISLDIGTVTVSGFADFNVPYHKMWHSNLA